MVLYMIGIGLGNEKDITLNGLNAIEKCTKIYLEHYTSILPNCNIEKLEKLYNKKIILASRDLVEQNAEQILNEAKNENIGFLVVGDVFGATTHTDLFIRAKKENINIQIINNTSILNAIGNTGLELYKFGKTTSMVFFEENWKPKNVYETIKENQKINAHTLILLDIKIAEPSIEDIKKERTKNLPPRFMTINQGLKQLIELEEIEKEKVISENSIVIGCARITCKDQIIKKGTIKELINFDFKGPLHCIIIPSKMHFIEEECTNLFK